MTDQRPAIIEYTLQKIAGYIMEGVGIATIVLGVSSDNYVPGVSLGVGLYVGGKFVGDIVNIRANINVPDISDKLKDQNARK